MKGLTHELLATFPRCKKYTRAAVMAIFAMKQLVSSRVATTFKRVHVCQPAAVNLSVGKCIPSCGLSVL